jgi:hypothetical protein
MKTERRHELQTNVLADSLARWIDKAKPYSRAALAVLIALVAGVFVWGYQSAQGVRRQSEGWSEYYDAMMTRDPRERLGDIAERYAGTSVAHWARVVLADIQLDDGTNRLFTDRAGAREELQNALEDYQAILRDSDDPMLTQRATFGLARAREGLAKDLIKAREEYRSIATKWPDSPYAAPAEARAKDLDRMATKSFYDWFAKYEPPRPMAKEPGSPGVRPDFMKDTLDEGGLKLPSLLDSNPSDSGSPPPDLGIPAADDTPAEPAKSEAAGDVPAATETPAAEPPATEPPASAPAADKPAEPAPQP